MPELQKIQVQYRGKLFSVPIENDNSLRLEHLKTIDQDAIGVVHYNVGDVYRKKVFADPKGVLRTRQSWLKQVRVVVKDTTDSKKSIVIDE